jgi:hypothetical protein
MSLILAAAAAELMLRLFTNSLLIFGASQYTSLQTSDSKESKHRLLETFTGLPL